MKISELSDQQIKEYCGMDEDCSMLDVYKSAAKSFIVSYTGLSDEEVKSHEDLTIAYLVLINDMSLNRDYTVNTDRLNPTVATALSLHSRNNVG